MKKLIATTCAGLFAAFVFLAPAPASAKPVWVSDDMAETTGNAVGLGTPLLLKAIDKDLGSGTAKFIGHVTWFTPMAAVNSVGLVLHLLALPFGGL